MARKAEEVYQDALALTEEEREKLLLLLTTQDNDFASPEIEEAWLEEAERRYRAVQKGEENLIPADMVMRELRDIVSR
jgi:hypothetical protein